MYCTSCGNENPSGSNYCEECGSSLEVTESHVSQDKQDKITNSEKKSSKSSDKLVCPDCGKDDQIRKLSIVYENGIQITQSSGPRIGVGLTSDKKVGIGVGLASDSGVSVSAISAKLAPPSEPSKGCLNVIAWMTFIFAAFCIAVGLWVSSAAESEIATQVLLMGLGTFIVGFLIKRFVDKEYSSKYDDYLLKIGLWGMLFYCGYDETVFEPKTGFSINANKLQGFYEKPLTDSRE